MNIDYSLYLVFGRKFLRNVTIKDALEQAIAGGVTVIQLREKDITTKEYYEEAALVKEITSKHNIPLIINDRLDIALAVDAEGVHLGQSDMPIREARRLLGKDKIIGGTVRSIEQALRAKKEGADYLGTGAVFPTSSKDDVSKIIGVQGLKEIVENVKIPKVGIGGINIENASEVISTGVEGIAVISAILASEDITKAARGLKNLLQKRRE